MYALYPPLEAFESHRIQVDDQHELYIEESGNPQGIPVIFLHGGPGSGCSTEHRRLFDPDIIEPYCLTNADQGNPYLWVKRHATPQSTLLQIWKLSVAIWLSIVG